MRSKRDDVATSLIHFCGLTFGHLSEDNKRDLRELADKLIDAAKAELRKEPTLGTQLHRR